MQSEVSNKVPENFPTLCPGYCDDDDWTIASSDKKFFVVNLKPIRC